MFSDKTYENLLDEALSYAPEGIDTRQGSVYYDAVAGQCLIIARMYSELSQLNDYFALATCYGEELDNKAYEHGITRHPATCSIYRLNYTGTAPPYGQRFFASGLFFVVTEEADEIYVKSETLGNIDDKISVGTIITPVSTVVGLKTASIGEKVEDGIDQETDENLRQRIIDKITMPSQNGNKQQYKVWCESITGVGRARILPLENGPNTVIGIIIDTDGRSPIKSIVDDVQEYIDPGAQGLGEGVSNIGSIFTAIAAEEVSIDLSVSVEVAQEYTITSAESEIADSVNDYLKNLSLSETESTVVRLSEIRNIIFGCPSIVDYQDVKLNSGTDNISLNARQIPVLGELSVTEIK